VDFPVVGRRRADVAFPRQRVAVFIDGCFWHGCPVHGTMAKANADYWNDKIATNRARDRDTDERLCETKWEVVRVWEHEPVATAADRVVAAINSSPSRARSPQ
jgi:DNA mismatch endonuclease (patch repair protein)